MRFGFYVLDSKGLNILQVPWFFLQAIGVYPLYPIILKGAYKSIHPNEDWNEIDSECIIDETVLHYSLLFNKFLDSRRHDLLDERISEFEDCNRFISRILSS